MVLQNLCCMMCVMKDSDDWMPAKILWKQLIMSVFFQVETDLKGCWFDTVMDIQMSVIKRKVKWSHYRPGVAQRVVRGIALLFHDCGTRRGWVVSSMPRPHFASGKDQVPIIQEAGWAPGPVWTGRKSRPHRDSIPDHPALSQSLYWLSYPAHPDEHMAQNTGTEAEFSQVLWKFVWVL